MTGNFNISDFGAKGDGATLDTAAIQRAVDACADCGKGTVYFPPGRYLSGTVMLCSNLTLYFAPGSVLLGSEVLTDYHTCEPNPQMPGYDWESILFAKGAHNIRLAGSGIIDGQGGSFLCGAEAYSVDDLKEMQPMKPLIRPSLLYLKHCEDVVLDGISLKNAAQFATLFEDCNGLQVSGVKIDNRQNLNTDGLHLIACRNIQISNCKLSCGDDAIVLNRSVERCVITNCIISSRWAGIRVGPFSTGLLRDIVVSNCVIHDTFGCAVKLQMGEGGIMENLLFQNIIMDNVTGPISIRLSHFTGWQEKKNEDILPGILRNVSFEHINASVAERPLPGPKESPAFPGESRSCINISGCEGYEVENISFRNIQMNVSGGGTEAEARGRDVPECDYRYPEYFLTGTPSAYGLFARHVRGLVLDGLRLELANPDARPAVVCDLVSELELCRIRTAPQGRSVEEEILLFDCRIVEQNENRGW